MIVCGTGFCNCCGGDVEGTCSECRLPCAGMGCSCNCGSPERLVPVRVRVHGLSPERRYQIVRAILDADLDAVRTIEWDLITPDDKRDMR